MDLRSSRFNMHSIHGKCRSSQAGREFKSFSSFFSISIARTHGFGAGCASN